jgi:hypothetical protein
MILTVDSYKASRHRKGDALLVGFAVGSRHPSERAPGQTNDVYPGSLEPLDQVEQEQHLAVPLASVERSCRFEDYRDLSFTEQSPSRWPRPSLVDGPNRGDGFLPGRFRIRIQRARDMLCAQGAEEKAVNPG